MKASYTSFEFSNSFIGFDSDWVHFKNREDFERVYTLPNDVKSSFERILRWKDMAFYMGDQLKEFNDFTKYPSLPSFVNSFEREILGFITLKNLKKKLLK